MKEYISQLKSFDFYSEFKVGYYLDALDEHKWKVAKIKEISKYGLRTTIQLRFDGYSSRFDSGYDLPSSHKLAPFRTHTLPYTGPATIEPKRDEPPQKYSAYTKELAKITADRNCEKLKPGFINQFLRGELFIIADYIITKRSFEKDFEDASSFLLNYIKEGCKILNYTVEYLKQFQKQHFDPSLYNVHPKIALLLSNTEFLFIINTIINSKDSRSEIQRTFQKWISNEMNFAKKIRQLVLEQKILTACDRIMEFKAANGRGLPWSLKKEVCLIMNQLKEGYVFPTPTDHKEIIEVLDYMGYLSNKGLLQREEEEKKTLSLIVSLIIGGNFEGRLRGLNELKKILDYYMRKKDYVLAQIQKTGLLAFLIDNKNFNPQIFKRSLPLFQFCYTNKIFGNKQLLQIIGLHKDKHELQLKSFYSSLSEFPGFLDQEAIVSFLKDIISALPLNQLLINLIKDYTLTAESKNTYFRQGYCKEGFELGLSYYWSLITSDRNDISSQLKYKLTEAFASLLGNIYYSKQVQKYFSASLTGIANRKNLQYYFKIIHETLKISKNARITKSIEAIEREVNIVDCVIEGLQNPSAISNKIWECMFEFLEEVTYISRKKLTFLQIKAFWNIRQCRTYLLKLLRKFRFKGEEDKSHQKIINKQLALDTMKQVISKLFLDSKQMQDYQNITPQIYQTADELIICYNHLGTKAFDYNYKHTLRVKNADLAFGLEFYQSIINQCKQPQIVEKAIHRYIEFYIRIKEGSRNPEAAKLTNWNFILQKISKFKRNVLLSYCVLLEDICGRMKSLNILQPDPTNLLVLNKATGVRKPISVPRYTSFWKLRHVLGKEFDLPGLNFDIQYTTSSYNQFNDTNFQKEEDFSMALITLAKEGPSIVITPTKNPKHPHLETLDNFYRLFADVKGDELFDWLSRGDEQTKRVVQILNKLPFVKKVQQKLLKLSSKDMNDTLDGTCLLKLNYQLKIIHNEKSPKLVIAMIQKGYIVHISKILTNKENYKSQEGYIILTNLMGFLTDLIKFSKMVKSIAPFFNDNFLVQLFHINKAPSEAYLAFLSKSFSLLKEVASNKELLTSTGLKPGIVFQSKSFEKAFQLVILNKTKERNGEILLDLARLTNKQDILLNISNKLLKSNLLLEKQLTCGGLFDIISGFIDKKIPSLFVENIKTFSRQIRGSDIMQSSEEVQNELLIGYMSLILKVYKSLAKQELFEQIIGQKLQKFINFIINDCLFNLEDPKKIKFKSPALRYLGYSLIQQFQYEKSGSKLSNVIMKSLKMGQSWRRQDEWNISPVKQVSHKFTGLKNLAATCYINSLLQQLYFIDNLRDQLIGVNAQAIEDKENIVEQIQNIFAHLRYSETPVYTTASLCKKFILEGQPIDPRVQTDVDEFFHSLMDKLERNLNKISKKDIINHIFGGELSNLIVGSACQHTSERIQPFLSIRLEIKDKKSLEEALRQFIKGEVLEGDNAYFCERCDAKVKAVKRVCLKTLPQILIVTLKRFQFDYQTMQKFKLNTYCSFPNVLNILPYTRAGLDKEFQPDQQQFEYRLKGVVIHYGISEAGHYTSYVQAESDKWYYFDDEKITQFNGEQLGNEAFGGIQENPFGDDQDKKKNAYLLFYEKIKKNVLTKVEDLSEAPIMKEIKQENVRNGLVNLLFEAQMQNYIYSILTEKQDPKLFLTYFHLIFLRSSRKREKMDLFYSGAELMLKGNKEYSQWYLSQINETFLNEFIFYAESQIKLLVSSLIIEAFKSNQDFQTGASALDQICAFIGKKNLVPAYKIITSAMKAGKGYEKYLRDICLGEIVIQFLKNPNKQTKISKNLQLKIKRETNQFGYGNSSFTDRPLIDQIDLLQCIESFKISIPLQQLDFYIKRAKKQKTQQSLAILIARKYAQAESFPKIQTLVMENLCQLQCSYQQEHVYTFYIFLLEQLAAVKDPLTSKRIEKLAPIYLKAMSESIVGFRSELLLLLGLFRICGSNLTFRDKISDIFQDKDGKKLLKDIKTWIKDASAGVGPSIRSGRMGYWRKSELKSMNYQTLNYLIETDDKVNNQKMLAALNAICEKHNTFFSTSGERFIKDDLVKFGRDKCKFIRSFGLMAQISAGELIRTVNYQDLMKAQYTT